MAGFGELFWGFLLFQLLFAGSFPAFGLGLGAVLGLSAVSATFSRVFSGFCAGFGSCFRDFCCFSYFFSAFSGFTAGFGVLFWGFLLFQLLFLGFFRLYGWVWGAVLGISAVSATFCEASGIMVEAQHHKLTTTY